MPSTTFVLPAVNVSIRVPTENSTPGFAEEVETSVCAALLSRSRARSDGLSSRSVSSCFGFSAVGLESSRAGAMAWRPRCPLSLMAILVVEMCVLVTVVEPAVATSREIRSARLHISVESLQAEGAIIGDDHLVVVVEGVLKW